MSLFVLASKDGWVDIMYYGLDAVGVDQQVIILKHWASTFFLKDCTANVYKVPESETTRHMSLSIEAESSC